MIEFRMLKRYAKLPRMNAWNNKSLYQIMAPFEFHILANQSIDISLGFAITKLQKNTIAQIFVDQNICKEIHILNGFIVNNNEIILKLENKTDFAIYFLEDEIIAQLIFIKSQEMSKISFECDTSMINLLDKKSLKELLMFLYFAIQLPDKKKIKIIEQLLEWYPYIDNLRQIYLHHDDNLEITLKDKKPHPLLIIIKTTETTTYINKREFKALILPEDLDADTENRLNHESSVLQKIEDLIDLHLVQNSSKVQQTNNGMNSNINKNIPRFILYGKEI